jgi:hypothetical protein
MPTKIKLPHDHNHTTLKYHRTVDEAFLCDADRAETFFWPDEALDWGLPVWLAFFALAIGVGIVFAAVAA